MDQQANYEILYENGFTESEIDHLNNLSLEYKREEESLRQPHLNRLEFVRWLVLTGKLTENIA
ncbi:hypothetical protein [Dictyobacter formicarum]|uniref:Uncharacterized protein n=1 Tax=Dictyobacter formicarum TaxID=2778368 RepID=A0ABQ3VNT0_9CHLR|nr:hypothetical protein [Dictyobacter formicarum]GHO87321.1 hypothetical protein KSZ_53270 [Dictyobacter formicarum]